MLGLAGARHFPGPATMASSRFAALPHGQGLQPRRTFVRSARSMRAD